LFADEVAKFGELMGSERRVKGGRGGDCRDFVPTHASTANPTTSHTAEMSKRKETDYGDALTAVNMKKQKIECDVQPPSATELLTDTAQPKSAVELLNEVWDNVLENVNNTGGKGGSF